MNHYVPLLPVIIDDDQVQDAIASLTSILGAAPTPIAYESHPLPLPFTEMEPGILFKNMSGLSAALREKLEKFLDFDNAQPLTDQHLTAKKFGIATSWQR